MGGRSLAPFLLAAAALVGACSEGANDVATAPEFVPRPPAGSCNFTTISSLVKTEFGASSTESSLAGDMKNAGAQTAQGTSIGYQILASIGGKYNGSQTSTSNASALTVALLKCMSIPAADVPSATVFDGALGAGGAFGVKAPNGVGPVTSHDGAWLLEPPGNQAWGSTLPAGTGSILVYGASRTDDGSFSNDESKSNIFDWSTLPKVTFNDPGVVVGECTLESQFVQHNAAGSTAEVLGFVMPSCFQEIALREGEPRTFAERMFRLFAPAPAYATLLTSTGSGGSKRTLSPFQVINPAHVNLAAQFTWKKSGNTVGKPFDPTVEYKIKTDAGTGFLQDYVLIWLEALGNQGTNVAVCNNWAYTNADGVAWFPTAYLNKSGGYTMVSKTTGTSSKPGVVDNAELPSVPAGSSVNSPLINVKNGSPGTCNTYRPGVDPLPPVPGPNGFKP